MNKKNVLIILFFSASFLAGLIIYNFIRVSISINYKRITSGPLYDKYMNRIFMTEYKALISEEDDFDNLRVCLQDYRKETGYDFTPYSLSVLVDFREEDKKDSIAILKFPQKYEVIDIYEVNRFTTNSKVVLCILHGKNFY